MVYQAVGVLGRGGTAVVELAYDDQGRPVAAKRVVVAGSAEQIRVARLRLRREAEILTGLHHPGIVPVIDVVDDGADVILVLPVMAENLADRVRRLGPLPAGEVARVGRVLLEALAAAHRHGVVHRDIKPANVLFDRDANPALADFGVAVTSDQTGGLTQAGMVVGSPAWMAPEQARGEPAGPASDIWSLGATLAFAATGRSGGGGELPPVLRGPIGAMMDTDPARRPSAAAVLGGLDGTAVGDAPPVITARDQPAALRVGRRMAGRLLDGPGHRPPAGRRRHRHRPVLGASALAAILAAAAAVVALGGGGPGRHPVASTGRSATCAPLPYEPCGSPPAPHTDGFTCDPGWFDLDASPADGCEAHSDYTAGTVLTATAPVRADLVPASSTDTFTTHVSGSSLNLCWGSLAVTLTAPPGTAEQVTVWHGRKQVARALSADGAPATATVHKPSCFGGDSEDLTVTVTAVAATGSASAADFTLTRGGGW